VQIIRDLMQKMERLENGTTTPSKEIEEAGLRPQECSQVSTDSESKPTKQYVEQLEGDLVQLKYDMAIVMNAMKEAGRLGFIRLSSCSQ
jgi:hypothetical protein